MIAVDVTLLSPATLNYTFVFAGEDEFLVSLYHREIDDCLLLSRSFLGFPKPYPLFNLVDCLALLVPFMVFLAHDYLFLLVE